MTRALLIALFIGAMPSSALHAAPHPFRGEYGPIANLNQLVEQTRRGNSAPLLKTLRRDPHLKALDTALNISQYLRQAQSGTFDTQHFLQQGTRAIRAYVQANKPQLTDAFRRNSHSELEQLLLRKLSGLAELLKQHEADLVGENNSTSMPRPSVEVAKLFGRHSMNVSIEPIANAMTIYGDDSAVARFGWQLSRRRNKETLPQATARIEVGRAVFLDDVALDVTSGAITPLTEAHSLDGKIRTQLIDKGIGPTRYAGNRFSHRTSGAFTLMQGEHDLALSLALERGGVPVYKPIGLLALPYWDWHPKMGWRPLAKYARVPQENLRVSDLKLLSIEKRKHVIAQLREKIASAARLSTDDVNDLDLVRFFAARMGRIAGLFEGGRTFSGKRFFHGMMHVANVSLLAEMVDFSESPGFVENRAQLRTAFRNSIYLKPDHNWPNEFQNATSEVIVFRFILDHFLRDIAPALADNQLPPPSLVEAIFKRAYREGLSGKRADDARDVLESSRQAFVR